MPSRTCRLYPGLVALLLALPAFAGSVYQWKDAKGVTHYSDSPPPGQQGVRNRELKDAPDSPGSGKAQPAEDAHCITARGNLAQLKGDRPVGVDADGDGKPDKTMTTEERAQQVQQNELTLKTYCSKPASAP